MTELTLLVRAAQEGNHRAFGQIVFRFQDMAFAYAYSIVGDSGIAQDAAQEAFLDAYQSLTKLREPAAFPGWFRRIVLKHSDRQIRSNREILVPLEDAYDLRSPVPDPAALMEQALFCGDVRSAIGLLPPKQRSVVTLYYVEEHSYREIAAFLEIPVSAVKKRLFNARKNLKERMIHMVQGNLQSTRPSQDDRFANQILFFTAVLDNDTETVRELVQKDVSLLTARSEWKMAIKRQYWTGTTALDQAVGYGYGDMTALLLGMGADVNSTGMTKMTPLHTAAIMNRPELVPQLIAAGASVNARSANGQTPLHVAAIRNRLEVLNHLVDNGADVNARDQHGKADAATTDRFHVKSSGEKTNGQIGRTAAGWAALLNHQSIVDRLVAAGAAQPTEKPFTVPNSNLSDLLETGIKVVDFCAPLKRGGVNGILTPFSGVGFMVMIGQIIRSVQKIYGGATVIAGLNTDHPHQEFWDIHLRECEADQNLTYVFEDANGEPNQPRSLIEQAISRVEEAAERGNEALLVIESKLSTFAGVIDAVRSSLDNSSGITALVYGHHTVGVLPPALSNLDSVLTFSMGRAQARLYPTIDPVRSSSTLFDESLSGTTHAAVVAEARHLMTRYDELRYPYDAGGPETLWYIDDDPDLQQTLRRGRRLDRFLTQPLNSLEPWTGTLGEFVSLADTIKGCQEILAGHHDAIPEEAFQFIGALEL